MRADGQFTPDKLLPLEKFGVGGMNSVRGYPYNFVVRDNGFSSSLELRIPVFRLPIPGLSKGSRDGVVEFAPFIDYGRSYNRDVITPDPDTFAGAGAGVRWRVSDRVQGEAYFTKQLKDAPNLDTSNLQDDGIYFRVMVNPF